jgi:hypothetical protein
MAEWASNGVFEFEDGSLSTDLKNLDRIQKRECKLGPTPEKAKSPFEFFANDFKAPEGTSTTDRAKMITTKWKILHS